MNKLFISLLLFSFPLFGAASSSSASTKKVGPFEIGEYDQREYAVQTSVWPKFAFTEKGAVAILARKSDPEILPSIDELIASLSSSVALSLGNEGTYGADPGITLSQTFAEIVRDAGNYNKICSRVVAALLYYDNVLYSATGEYLKGQAPCAPYLDKVEKLGADIVEHVLRLPGAKPDDKSPVVTWEKTTEKELSK